MNEATKKRIADISSGIIPEGYKKTKVGIVPVEWENKKFSDIFTEKSIRTSDFEKYPLYSLTIEEGVVPKSERYERSHLVKKDDLFKVVSENDYVYNPMNVRFGALARYKGKNPVSISGYYDIFSVNENYSMVYMDNFLLSAPMINYYNSVSTGSLKEKQRVHFSQFIEFNLPIPSLPEQKKIAEILSTQDKLIELQEKKIEKLKELKKAYLQKMFPKKGCKYPELRFKGFTDAWELRKLGECAEFNPKSELPDTFEYVDLESVVGTDILSHRTESKSSAPSRAQRLAQKGDVFYQTVRPYQKNNCIFEKDDNNWVFSTGYAQLRPVNDGYFLLTLLQNDDFVKLVLDRCTGTSYPAINSNDLADIDVSIPIDSKEQHQIGAYFKNLDILITLHQRKSEQEKQKKKALMQLLLTGKVRVIP